MQLHPPRSFGFTRDTIHHVATLDYPSELRINES
jgi:hypothetical protein